MAGKLLGIFMIALVVTWGGDPVYEAHGAPDCDEPDCVPSICTPAYPSKTGDPIAISPPCGTSIRPQCEIIGNGEDGGGTFWEGRDYFLIPYVVHEDMFVGRGIDPHSFTCSQFIHNIWYLREDVIGSGSGTEEEEEEEEEEEGQDAGFIFLPVNSLYPKNKVRLESCSFDIVNGWTTYLRVPIGPYDRALIDNSELHDVDLWTLINDERIPGITVQGLGHEEGEQ